MRYEVAGAWTYHVSIGDSAVTEDGRASEQFVTVDEGSKTVVISDQVAVDQRMHWLLHGLAHATVTHVGSPSSDEALCDLMATFARSAMRWAAANGGETALMRLTSGEGPREFAGRMNLSQSRYCALCSSTAAPGSVEWMADPLRAGIAIVTIYCPACEHLQIWRESIGPTGLPTAEVVGEATFDTGEKMRAFLKRHPTYGVMYVED